MTYTERAKRQLDAYENLLLQQLESAQSSTDGAINVRMTEDFIDHIIEIIANCRTAFNERSYEYRTPTR